MRATVVLAAMLAMAGGVAPGAARPDQHRDPAPVPQNLPQAPHNDGIVVIGPRQEDDIVMTGVRPVIRGGLWRFRRSGTMNHGTGTTSLPLTFATCLPGGELETALRRASGERSALLSGMRCNDLKLTVAKGRVAGRRICTGAVGGVRSATDISGRYDARQLSIMLATESLHDGHQGTGSEGWQPERPKGHRWRITAVREGDCPATPVRSQRNQQELVPLLFTPDIDDQQFDGIPQN